jgi:predicted DNA-binding transcriptional regulator AlpA
MRPKKRADLDELPDRLVDTGSTCEFLNKSRSQLYQIMATDPTFPRPIKLHGSTRNAWLFSELMQWIKAQPRATGFKAHPPRKDGGGIVALRRAQWEREQEAADAHAPK